MRARIVIGLVVALSVAGASLAIAQPRVETVWAIYVATATPGSRETLFLEPYLDVTACADAARYVAQSGARATCRSHTTVMFARSTRDMAIVRDFAPGGAWDRLAALCGIRKAPFAPSRAARTATESLQ